MVAAVVAGGIALFAPCCVSVMLPAYLASSLPNRRTLVAMTFLFGAGVATIVLPIALGASVLRRLVLTEHTTIYVVGGLLLLGLAVYALLGGSFRLPMPGRPAGRPVGASGVYTLGVFSGVASSCCAPVLAGVVALSGVASSFGAALGLGTAYVFGMVAPLFVISLLWDRYDWRASALFRPRSFEWRVAGFHRRISGTNLASGVLFALMGIAALWIGLTGDAMPASGGWQARLALRLQRIGTDITDVLAWLPGWVVAVGLVVVVAALGRVAFRQVGWRDGPGGERSPEEIEVEEGVV